MQIDARSGLVDTAEFISSPNCDERPENTVIDLVVIHNISLPPGEFGGSWIDRFFCNRLDPSAHDYFAEICDMQVSAHLLIKRDGSLVQYVPFNQRAWHAGESSFRDRKNCNDFSIGIELEGTDEIPYEDAQYQALAEVIRQLRAIYPEIQSDHILGHCDIAPGRKTDPGPVFDWVRLRSLID
jgi:AmpD protein